MVFVTGGTGLVGSHIICQLLKNGHQVRALCRPTSDKKWFTLTAKWLLDEQYERLINQLEWVEGDVNDVISLIDGIQGCSQVYHAAAVVSFAKSDQSKLKSINVDGTANMVNACLSATHKISLCFISSTASIGGVEKKMVDETESYNPDNANSYYSSTKYLAELEVIRGREEGLDAAIINPCIVLGFGNWNQGSARIFKNGSKGFPFYTTGANAFVDARDVALAATLLMDKQCFSDRYLCTGWNKSFYDVFHTISQHFGAKPPRFKVSPFMAAIAWRLASVVRFFTGIGIITKESAEAGMKTRLYDSSNIQQAVGMEFRDFDTAVQEICQAYQNQMA